MTERYADPAHRYRLDAKIATGGMGVVWRATDMRLGRTVAVKVLKSEYAEDITFRTRFETEARSAAALHHPGIAGIFDYSAEGATYPEESAPFLVMEYVEGEPLSALLARAKDAGRTLDVEAVRTLMAQTADGLAVAHAAGIVHRDIKPANLLITPERQVKITDFGIARAGDSTAITRTGAVMGTPQYLSPEQARGTTSTPASDVYSLGIVAFECLAGYRPFEAETPVATVLAHLQKPVPDLPDTVPADLAAVVRRAMAKEPRDRFPDGAAFAAALRDPSRFLPPPGAGTVLDPATAVMPAATGVVPPVSPGTGEVPDVGHLDPVAAYEGTEEDDGGVRWGIVIAVILVVLAVVLGAFLLLGGDGDDEPEAPATTASRAPTTETTPTTPSEPTTSATTEDTSVTINADDYVGEDVRTVESELSALGLRPTLVEQTNDGSQTAGVVTSVTPSGTVQRGDTITVTYWGAAPPPTTSAAPTTTAPTTPTTAPPTTAPTTAATTESTSAEEGVQP
ncbi:serine/threonine protein kinase [Nocardioides sp. GY 10113]|uniref:serine/threonine-protein kinase n=1 Tax=Nocardioides sp. GY 10113 TaxID=2569761 RepID=UPI0010A83006|nr:serine/threonine-protein kinase [Nocardioides sp. GY 10113]TIC89093.1 serine/threonine protein kinase [Nocardioides sp. GY 10113]